jgi:hypothetical protein
MAPSPGGPYRHFIVGEADCPGLLRCEIHYFDGWHILYARLGCRLGPDMSCYNHVNHVLAVEHLGHIESECTENLSFERASGKVGTAEGTI